MIRPSRSLALLAALALAGCVTVWSRIDEPKIAGPDNGYTIEAPKGWVRFGLNREGVTLTRDGLQVQFIETALLTPEQAFKKSKKSLPGHALPSDVAALVLAELRANPVLADLTLKENLPQLVAGKPGFRLLIQWRNERGALFDRLVFGTLQDKRLLIFSYQALDTHFFARDLPEFEKLVASYRLGGAS